MNPSHSRIAICTDKLEEIAPSFHGITCDINFMYACLLRRQWMEINLSCWSGWNLMSTNARTIIAWRCSERVAEFHYNNGPPSTLDDAFEPIDSSTITSHLQSAHVSINSPQSSIPSKLVCYFSAASLEVSTEHLFGIWALLCQLAFRRFVIHQ